MRFLFTNDGAIEAANADINNTSDLPSGKVGIFDVRDYASGNIDLQGAEDSLPDHFQIGVGAYNDDDIRYTNAMDKSNIKRVTVKPYKAPVRQVTRITPDAGFDGQPVIKFTRVDKGFEPFERIAFHIDQKEDDTEADVAEKFADVINDADESTINDQKRKFVEASVDGSDLVITARFDNVSFNTAFDSEDSSGYEAAIEVTPARGSGTPEELKDLEEMSWGNLSHHQRVVLPQTPNSFVKPGGTYDIVTIEYENNYDTALNKSFSHQEITFAFEEGELSNDGQDFAAIFGAPVYAPNATDD